MASVLAGLDAQAWATFSRLLDEALQCAPDERERWLQDLPAEHAPLKSLLREALGVEQRMQAHPPAEHPRIALDDAYLFQPGASIGPYTLIAPIGRGGMGEVWRATRGEDGPRRDVALKLPHTWLLNASTRLRLSRERDILAGLDHPHIAQLYDAGLAADGQPWLALERIEGEQIDRHCRERQLSLAARLELFLQVLDAVQAAHARLIVHRDLKPSNILVNAAGQAKLLDFGIAKLIDADGTGEATELTQMSGRAATPNYAAPEQLAGDAITVATDIYALGVVLYELLCGKRPFAGRGLRTSARDTPPLASTRIEKAHATECGGLTPRALGRALAGDLDAILSKALAAAPTARYRSIAHFAQDLQRHLHHQPIEARHITRAERARKFVRRHRLALGVAALFVISIGSGLGLSLWQAHEARLAAQRATAEAQRANATRDFLIGVFRESDRSIARDIPAGEIRARDLLDAAASRIGPRLAGQPETQIDLLRTVSEIYSIWKDGERYARASEQLKTLIRQTHGETDPRYIEALLDDATMSIDARELEPARAPLAQARTLIDRAGLQDSRLAALWWFTVSEFDGQDTASSPARIAKLQKAYALYQRHAPNDADVPWVLMMLALEYFRAEDYRQAREYVREGIRIENAKPQGTRNDWVVASLYSYLGVMSNYLGDSAEAERAHALGAQLKRATFGYEDRDYWNDLSAQARMRCWRGDNAAALRGFEDTLAQMRGVDAAVLGDARAWVRLEYGLCELSLGRHAEAIRWLEAAAAIPLTEYMLPVRPEDIRLALGDAYDQAGRTEAARSALHSAYALYLKQETLGNKNVLAARERWGRFLLDHARGDADRRLAAAEFTRVIADAGTRPLLAVAAARAGLARLALQRGDHAAAVQLSQQSLNDLAAVRELHDLREDQHLRLLHADILAATGDAARAAPLRAEAQAALQQLQRL